MKKKVQNGVFIYNPISTMLGYSYQFEMSPFSFHIHETAENKNVSGLGAF
jgi:hypothetical protein